MVHTTQSADGTTIAYERSGEGSPLILVGGALNSRHSAAPFVPLLEPRFSVLRYDRRGRGGSGDTPPYAPAREVEDLNALIDAAGGAAVGFGPPPPGGLPLPAAAGRGSLPQVAGGA